MINGDDLHRARDALHSIPADLPRDEWLKAGMGFHAAGGGLDDFDQWSASAPSYDKQSCRATWRSFKTGKGISAGTLFAVAAKHGWTYGDKPQQRSIQAPKEPVEPPRLLAPGMSPSEIWERCKPATSVHGYIVEKRAAGVPLDNLKVVPEGDPLRIANESMAGALVVPVTRGDGTLSSLQFVTTGATAEQLKAQGKPSKLNLTGYPVDGFFTVGEIVPGGVVNICEGIATAWSCWQVTGGAAVSCFGWGRVRTVAAELRKRDATAVLVLVPDVGKELDAQNIANEIDALVATMPPGEANNFDANDYAQREGNEALAVLLEGATAPPKPEPMSHPLAKFVDIDGTAKPPRWVIPGFIGHGVVVINGAPGVGKTTALLPLAMTAAGLHGDDLMPRQWRNVVYVTEDVEQARRILAGMVGYSNLQINLASVRERLHIVEAVRLDPEFVATVGATYREQFTRVVEGVEVLPLVVLDTKSAVLAMDSENDNSEASEMMAALKQGFDGLPVWLIGHTAKANLSRSDVSGLTSRGASAIDGDANQTMFLVCEGESRFLVEGKVRFEPKWPELEIVSHTAQTFATDEFGNIESVTMRWGVAAPAQQTRKEAAKQATEAAKQVEAATLRQDVRDALDTAWQLGNPLNRAGVKAQLNRKNETVGKMIEILLSERWLHEVEVPSKVRVISSKAAYLVNLTTVERETALSGGGLPAAKLLIPASWQKSAIPLVPAPESESVEVKHE